MPPQKASSFAEDLAAVRGGGSDSFAADLEAVRSPSAGGKVLGAASKLAHIPYITEAPKSARDEAARFATEFTTPTLDQSKLMAQLKGFVAGGHEAATGFMNLFDIGSIIAPEGRLGTAVSGLLAARGAGNVAEGVQQGNVAQGLRGGMEAVLAALHLARTPRVVQGEIVPDLPPKLQLQLPAETVDAVSATRVPEHYPAPTPAVRPALPPGRPPIITPPPADPSFVRGVPAELAVNENDDNIARTIEILRNANRPAAAAPPVSRGFAEPPIAVTPPLPPNVAKIVEAAQGTGHSQAVREATTVHASAPATRARAADVIVDARLAGPAAAPDAPAAKILAGTADDTATLRGRATFESKLPKGANPTVAQMDALDKMGAAYRKASGAYDAAKIDYAAGKITAEQLQAAKLTHRQAGKSLNQLERQTIKEAEAAAKNVNREAGFVAPQLLQAMAGGTIGGVTGASLDEEDPIRGAMIGALVGAAAPGTVIGTARSVKKEGLHAVGKLYVSGLLSGPMTAVRNVTSTAANGLFRMAAHPAAYIIDRARGQQNIALGEIGPEIVATWAGFKRGAGDAFKTFLTGNSPYAGLFSGAPNKSNELMGGLGNAANWPGRALDALDTWLGRIVESQVVAGRSWQEATRRGVPLAQRWKVVGNLQGNPTAAIQAAADGEARRVLFRGDPGELTQRFIDLRNTLNKTGLSVAGKTLKIPVGDFLIPFVRVPAMIARQAAEMSPLGLLQSTAGQTPREVSDHLGRVFAGSMILGAGAYWTLEGRVSGAGPSNPQDRSKLYETGWRPYSVNVPGNVPQAVASALGGSKAEDGSYWLPTNALGPLGMALTMVADTIQGITDAQHRDDATTERTIAEAAGRLGSNLVNQTFLTDAAELSEAMENPSLMSRYLQRKAGSLVPSAVRQVARAQDPIVRDPQSMLEAIQANLPGVSTALPPRTDRFGSPIRRPRSAGEVIPRNPAASVLEAAGAPLNKSAGRISVTEPELRKALESAGFTFDDAGQLSLSASEKRALTNKRGQELATIIGSLKNSDTYRALPPAAQKIIIDRLKNRVESDRRMPEILQLLRDRRGGASAR